MNKIKKFAVDLWHLLYFRQHNYIIKLKSTTPVEEADLNFVEFTPQLLEQALKLEYNLPVQYIEQGFTGIAVKRADQLVGCGFIALEQAIHIGHNVELNLQQAGFIFEPIIFNQSNTPHLRLAIISQLCQQYHDKKIFYLIDMEHSSEIEQLRKIGYELLMILDTTRVFRKIFYTKTTRISATASELDDALRVVK